MKPLTLDWVEKAEGDFLVATQIMRRRKQRVYDAACFHCQQAVEKYLKARLFEAGLPFPKTHDLVILLHLLLPPEPLWKPYEPAVKALTDYAVSFRYPGNNATLAEAKRALKYCRSLRGGSAAEPRIEELTLVRRRVDSQGRTVRAEGFETAESGESVIGSVKVRPIRGPILRPKSNRVESTAGNPRC